MDEPVPIRRALIGCGALAIVGIVAVLLVRPAIFTFAEPRDDSVVTMGTLTAATAGGPMRHDVILSRSYGWDGEEDLLLKLPEGNEHQARLQLMPCQQRRNLADLLL